MKSANFSNKYKKYYEAINYLETLGNINGGYRKANIKTHPNPKMFLDRMNDLLNKIGNPEIGFKYIHITGTVFRIYSLPDVFPLFNIQLEIIF